MDDESGVVTKGVWRHRIFIEILLVFLSVGLQMLLGLDVLDGGIVSLSLVIACTLFLPGWLFLSRFPLVLPKNWIVRFGWVLAVGIATHVLLGIVFRRLEIPVSYYLVSLNAAAIGMLFLPQRLQASVPAPSQPIGLNLMLGGLVLLCTGIALYNGSSLSQYRFDLFEDVSWFSRWVHQLAYPDPELGFQIVGRYSWLYTYGAWIWLTDVSAVQMMWYWITPLFLWMVPLLVFALAYTLRPDNVFAVYAAAASVLAGLLMLDPFFYNLVDSYGHNTFAQIHTLRYFSTAIVLPLAQMICVAYLRRSNWALLVIAVSIALSLGLMHPRQAVILAVTVGVFGLGHLLWQRRGYWYHIALLGVLVVSLVPAILERYVYPSAGIGVASPIAAQTTPAGTSDIAEVSAPYVPPTNMVQVPFVEQVILSPQFLTGVPLMGLTVALGLVWGLDAWRKPRLEALYAGTATASVLLLVFTPGITQWVAFAVAARQLPGLLVGVPVPIILGLSWWFLVRSLPHWVGIGGAALLVLLVSFEPFSFMFGSGLDQQRAFNAAQAPRDILAADLLLTAALQPLPNFSDNAQDRYLSPPRIAGYIGETKTDIRITRSHSEQMEAFYDPDVPFWGRDDINWLQQNQFTVVIVPASLNKADQFMYDTRFEYLESAGGYRVFRILDYTANNQDIQIDQLNQAVSHSSRYDARSGFQLHHPPLPAQSLPDPDTLPPYAAAFAHTMTGDLAEAEHLWMTLSSSRTPHAADAHAQVLLAQGQRDAAFEIWRALLTEGHVFIADRLLIKENVYRIPDELVQTAVDLTQEYAATWELFTDSPDINRERAAVLISEGMYDAATAQLEAIPLVFTRPEDIWTRAALYLEMREISRAQAVVAPFLQRDIRFIPSQQHPDRWTNHQFDVLDEGLRDPNTFNGSFRPQFTMMSTTDGLQGQVRYGQPSFVGCPAETLRVWLTGMGEQTERYAETILPLSRDVGLPQVSIVELLIPDDLPPFTPGQLFAQARCDDYLTYPLYVETVMLNPVSATLPSTGESVAVTFDDHIALHGYHVKRVDGEMLEVTLYWQTDARPGRDYQVMLHLLDADGEIIEQADSSPMNGMYPTTQWAADVLIPDTRRLPFSAEAAAIRVGMYQLSDGVRLPILAAEQEINNHSLIIPID